MIYFIKRPDNGRIKIGTTARLAQRLVSLAAEFGPELEVLAVADGSFDEERALHRRFEHHRVEGEWFEPGDDLVAFIVSEATPWDEESPPKPVRVELTDDIHRMLRKLAADDDKSMAAFARETMEKVVREEFKRRGLK